MLKNLKKILIGKKQEKNYRSTKKWKKSGHVFGKTNDALWLRFKKSCDNFFEAKKNHQSLLIKEEKKKYYKI